MIESVALQWAMILVAGALRLCVCQHIGLLPILGNLARGILVGPSVLDSLAEGFALHLFTELGVLLLMLTICEEF